jgi:WD40 repeat protein
VAAGYSDGCICIFDLESSNPLQTKLELHSAPISCVVYMNKGICSLFMLSSDSFFAGEILISGCKSGNISVISTTQNKLLKTIKNHVGSSIDCLDVSPQDDSIFLICSSNRRVSIWSSDVTSDSVQLHLLTMFKFGEEASEPYFNKGIPSIAKFSALEQNIVLCTSLTRGKHIIFFDFENGRFMRSVAIPSFAKTMELSPSGSLLFIVTSGSFQCEL